MVTIAHIVGKLISRKPFVAEALTKGIINYGALADLIQEDVEKEFGKKVKHSAVMMALRRYSDKNAKLLTVKFDEDTDIAVRSDLVEITIVKNMDSIEIIRKMYEIIDLKKGDFISIVQAIHEITIITNKKHEKKFLDLLKNQEIKSIIRNLSSLTIKIPEESIEGVGLFYMITRAISWENISMVEIVSSFSEMTLILKTDDTPYAFKIVKKLIEENS